MSFTIYLIGTLLMIGGLVYAGHILHLATHWIVVAALVMGGLGVMAGVQGTRQKDPS
jgi:hypothetical protein